MPTYRGGRTLYGHFLPAGWTPDPDYFLRHIRAPARFDMVLRALGDGEVAALLEIGPNATLGGLARKVSPGTQLWPPHIPYDGVRKYSQVTSTVGRPRTFLGVGLCVQTDVVEVAAACDHAAIICTAARTWFTSCSRRSGRRDDAIREVTLATAARFGPEYADPRTRFRLGS